MPIFEKYMINSSRENLYETEFTAVDQQESKKWVIHLQRKGKSSDGSADVVWRVLPLFNCLYYISDPHAVPEVAVNGPGELSIRYVSCA